MTYLINALALPITLSLALGLIVGWLTYGRNTAEPRSSWLPFGLLVFAVGVYAATAHIVPGRHGFWLEAGLVLFASYLVGCTIGSAFRHMSAEPGLSGNAGLAAAGPANALIAKLPPALEHKSGSDDLMLIWGVGAKLAHTLNELGTYRFQEIANWSGEDIRKFESHAPEFRGRVARDEWLAQCKRLAAGWRPEKSVGERSVKD